MLNNNHLINTGYNVCTLFGVVIMFSNFCECIFFQPENNVAYTGLCTFRYYDNPQPQVKSDKLIMNVVFDMVHLRFY